MDLFSHQSSKTNLEISSKEKLSRLRLIRSEGIGPITFGQLLHRCGSAEEALRHISDLARRGGRQKPLKICDQAAAEAELRALDRIEGTALFKGTQDYPAQLAALEDSPPVLFVLGHTSILAKESIALVGARNASAPGLKTAQTIAHNLADAGIVTVSGLARGIDTIVHRASLHGGTIACVAGGVDIVYPKENAALYREIIAGGAVVSEMPMGVRPQARHFPRRNRLISGLSAGVLVVEAAEKSGSLITARFAAEQGRDVFAIPGSPLDPRSKGCNRLIKDGAILVESAHDILLELQSRRNNAVRAHEDLPLFAPHESPADADGAAIEKLLGLLSHTPVSINDLVRLAEMETSTVLSGLLMLELAGKVRRYPGGRVALDEDGLI